MADGWEVADGWETEGKKKPAEIRQGPAKWKRTASKLYTPVLEGLGMTGGAVVGSATASPGVGTVLGAGLGYAGGKGVAALADEYLGIGHDAPQPQNMREATYETTKNVLTGATMEAGGQLIGLGGGKIANKLAQFKREGAPLSNKLAQTRAANVFSESTEPTGAITKPLQRENVLGARRLERRINQGVPQTERATFTAGQRTGNPKLGGLEKSQMNTDPAFRSATEYGDAALVRAARSQTEKAIPGERGGVTIKDKVQKFAAGLESQAQAAEGAATTQASKYAAPTDAQPLGEDIVSTIKKAREPYTAATKKAYAEVPDYPMEAENFDTTLKTLIDKPGMKNAENILNDFAQYAEREPRTTQGFQEIDKTISEYLRNPQLDTQARGRLKEVQQALRKDLDLLGEAAEKGDVALHEGKLVVPSRLESEITALDKRIAEEAAKPAGVDVKAMQKELMDKGIPAMRQVREDEAAFAARITKDYEKAFKKAPPIAGQPQGIKVYRGDNAADPLKGAPDGTSYFFTSKQPARLYGKVSEHSLDIKNPKVVDAGGRVKGEWGNYDDLIAEAKQQGHDGLVVKNVVDVPSDMEEGYYADRLAKYRSDVVVPFNVSKQVIKAPESELTTKLTAQKRALQAQLEGLQPAEDVAAKYANARRTAKDEFDRFTRGALEDIYKQGNEASGAKLTAESVPHRFTTPSGADDLIRAIGDKEAQGLMRNHYAAQANTYLGKNPAQLAKWVSKNRPVLEKYGLYDEFKSLHATQKTVIEARATLDQFNKSAVGKILDAEPEKAISYVLGAKNPEAAMRELKAFGNGDKEWENGLKVALREHIVNATELTARDTFGTSKASLAKLDKLGSQYERAMKVLYSPKEIQTLRDLHQTVETLARNKQGVPGGGSDTAANLTGNIQARIAYGATRDAAKHLAGGITNGIANLAAAVTKIAGKEHAELTAQFVKEALLDPAKAKELLRFARDRRSPVAIANLESAVRGYAKAQERQGLRFSGRLGKVEGALKGLKGAADMQLDPKTVKSTLGRGASMVFGDKGGGGPDPEPEETPEPRKEYGSDE